MDARAQPYENTTERRKQLSFSPTHPHLTKEGFWKKGGRDEWGKGRREGGDILFFIILF